MKRKYQLVGFVLLIVVLLVSAIIVLAQQDMDSVVPAAPDAALGSSFTYQGYLSDSVGNPVNTDTALCDFRFGLYNALTGGSQIGAYSEVIGADVKDGLFTVHVNVYNEFGSQAFNGDARYLSISVKCGSDTIYTVLGMRQRLSAVPYALTAQSVHSSEDIKLYLSPHSMVIRNSTGIVLTPLNGGGVQINVEAGGTKYVSIPVSTFGTLFGSTMQVKAMRVCYKDTGNVLIDTAVVSKNTGTENGEAYYIMDQTDRSEDTYTCYTVNATAPFKTIDNSTWVQFNLTNLSPMGTANLYIYTVELTLTQSLN